MAKPQPVAAQRGDIYLVNFDPTVRSEIQKMLPAVVLQNNIANRYSPLTIVAAVTAYTGKTLYPIDVLLRTPEGGIEKDSVILLDQIRTIDKRRLTKKLGRISIETLQNVNRALAISVGLTAL